MASAEQTSPDERFRQSFQQFFTLDAWEEERELWKSRPKEPPKGRPLPALSNEWCARLKAWDEHLETYHLIDIKLGSAGSDAGEGSSGAWKVKKLDGLLTILDSKVGMALTLNSLLLAAVTIFVSILPSIAPGIRAPLLEIELFGVLCVSTFVAVALLLWNLFRLLYAFRRVVWGNLKAIQQSEDVNEDIAPLKQREREYADFLIISVARRTNTFRVAMRWTTKILICLAVTTGILGVFLIWVNVQHLASRQSNHPNGSVTTQSQAPEVTTPAGTNIQVSGGQVQFGAVSSLILGASDLRQGKPTPIRICRASSGSTVRPPSFPLKKHPCK